MKSSLMEIMTGGVFGNKTIVITDSDEEYPAGFLEQAAAAFDPMLLSCGQPITFKYKEAPEIKFKRIMKNYDPNVPSLMTPFVGLYLASSDSIPAQDALMAFYRDMGLIGGNYEITDTEAQDTFNDIVNDQRLSNIEKDAYLSALDVAVQNHHARGMAADILTDILDMQYQLLKARQA